ncbi:MAG: chromate transporter [Candidatus Krumholzibacteriota bacterium]|nr:chromate transporter [Candidatus Krumholzibacteriota bacterium]
MGLYWSIFIAFLKVGTFGYGGGPSLIPLIEKEVVTNYGWLTAEEFIDANAMANTLPGPIATKLAICIGMRTAGPLGAASALVAMLLPSSIFIIILTMLYYKYRSLPSVQGMIRGVRPVVIALLMVTVAHLGPKSVVGWDTFIIALIAFIVVFYLNIHPVYTILSAAFIGFMFYR